MKFTFTQCTKDDITFQGLLEIRPLLFTDQRGTNFEAWNSTDFQQAGIFTQFVQDNQSISKAGVYRGLHFQKKHAQAKLVRCVYGSVVDVVMDLRRESPTFGKTYSLILDGKQQNMLFIPKGFAHGFTTLQDDSVLSYKCSDFYAPKDEGGVKWNWSYLGNLSTVASYEPISSEKDRNLPPFSLERDYFDMEGNWIGAEEDDCHDEKSLGEDNLR